MVSGFLVRVPRALEHPRVEQKRQHGPERSRKPQDGTPPVNRGQVFHLRTMITMITIWGILGQPFRVFLENVFRLMINYQIIRWHPIWWPAGGVSRDCSLDSTQLPSWPQCSEWLLAALGIDLEWDSQVVDSHLFGTPDARILLQELAALAGLCVCFAAQLWFWSSFWMAAVMRQPHPNWELGPVALPASTEAPPHVSNMNRSAWHRYLAMENCAAAMPVSFCLEA